MLKNLSKSSAFIFLFLVVSKLVFLLLQPERLSVLDLSSSLKALVWGLRFDLAALAALSLPIILAIIFKASSSIIKLLLVLTAFWIVTTTLSDTVYLLESSRHVTFEVFTGEGSVAGLLSTLITKYLTYTLTALALLAVFFIITVKAKLQASHQVAWHIRLIVFLSCLAVSITLVRGGWSDVPQSPMSTFDIGNNQQALIAWNAPYSITYYLAKGPKKAALKVSAPSSEADKQLVTKELTERHKDFVAPKIQANIIVVLLESWTALDMFDEVMPNFNAQRIKSLSTQNFFANGYRTVEGIFSTFCSYPNPIGGGVAGTQLQAFEYQCLPQILHNHGWQTHFIQGSYRGIVGSYAQSIGFEHSYGKSDYPFEGTHNYWGFMDDDIYRFSLQTIKNAQTPYLITINTGTNHDSYLPDETDYIFGKDSRINIRRSVTHHSDAALGRFIKELDKTITEPTLIIFLADHTTGEGNQLLEKNAIPFLMYATDSSIESGILPANAGQFDVAPTIIDWLGGSVPWFSGDSLLSSNYQGHASYSYGKTVAWIKDNRLLIFDTSTQQPSADCYHIAEDSLLVTSSDCTADPFVDDLSYAESFTRYSQDLLFQGKTTSLGDTKH